MASEDFVLWNPQRFHKKLTQAYFFFGESQNNRPENPPYHTQKTEIYYMLYLLASPNQFFVASLTRSEEQRFVNFENHPT